MLYGFGQVNGLTQWYGQWCDNQVVIHIVSNLMSQSERVIALGRAFTLHALKVNVLVQARHAPGADNSLAGALSHQQIEWFRELDPEANEFPETLHPEV